MNNIFFNTLDNYNQIINFINDFKKYDKDNVLINTFTKGHCNAFAIILLKKFEYGQIIWDNYCNHCIYYNPTTQRFYDIRGEYFPQNYEYLEILNVSIVGNDNKYKFFKGDEKQNE
jgi:hypothetical protein